MDLAQLNWLSRTTRITNLSSTFQPQMLNMATNDTVQQPGRGTHARTHTHLLHHLCGGLGAELGDHCQDADLARPVLEVLVVLELVRLLDVLAWAHTGLPSAAQDLGCQKAPKRRNEVNCS